MMLKWLFASVVLYGGLVALLYVVQRYLQYFPERQRTTPSAAGLSEAEEAVLDTVDGERVIVWHVPPREGQPIFLYFHGNGGSLRWRVARFRTLIADGSGLVALSYRGYGGSSGPRRLCRGRGDSLFVCRRAVSGRAYRPVGRIARLCARDRARSGKTGRAPRA